VIPLSLLLVLASLGLLVAGLAVGSPALVWGSLAASLAAGGCLLVAVLHRRGQGSPVDAVPGGGPPAVPLDLGGPVAELSVRPPSAVAPPRPLPPVPPQGTAPPQDTPQRPPPTPAGSEPAGAVGSPSRPPDEVRQSPEAATAPQPAAADEPGIEDIPVQEALRAAQLSDSVLVIDGRPRYHLPTCELVVGAITVPLPVSAARRAGFTPCAVCRPDATLLARFRSGTGSG
jgi:hypothetical protein